MDHLWALHFPFLSLKIIIMDDVNRNDRINNDLVEEKVHVLAEAANAGITINTTKRGPLCCYGSEILSGLSHTPIFLRLAMDLRRTRYSTQNLGGVNWIS